MTKAIAFDIGGVIIDLNYDRAINSFKTKAGFKRIDEFLDPWVQKGFFSLLETGKISTADFLEQCLKECRPGTTLEVLAECLGDFLEEINPLKAGIIRELHKNYPLYLLSNNNPLSMIGCEKLFKKAGIPMDEYFTKRFISSEMKMAKPNAEIFLAAIREIGCAPEEILYIDDSQKNVDAASALGIDARLCDSAELFSSILKPLIMDSQSSLSTAINAL